MYRKTKELDRFYRNLIRKEKLSHKEALKIYEMLHRQAVGLGVISSKNMMEGIEVDIRMAKAINGLLS